MVYRQELESTLAVYCIFYSANLLQPLLDARADCVASVDHQRVAGSLGSGDHGENALGNVVRRAYCAQHRACLNKSTVKGKPVAHAFREL